MDLKTKIGAQELSFQTIKKKEYLEMGHGDKSENEFEAGIAIRSRSKLKRPNFYRVLLLNDDYTPMNFVIFILEKFFKKDREDAIHIMLNVHHKGMGECGVYSFEVAETKVAQVMDCARENQHPLKCVMERK